MHRWHTITLLYIKHKTFSSLDKFTDLSGSLSGSEDGSVSVVLYFITLRRWEPSVSKDCLSGPTFSAGSGKHAQWTTMLSFLSPWATAASLVFGLMAGCLVRTLHSLAPPWVIRAVRVKRLLRQISSMSDGKWFSCDDSKTAPLSHLLKRAYPRGIGLLSSVVLRSHLMGCTQGISSWRFIHSYSGGATQECGGSRSQEYWAQSTKYTLAEMPVHPSPIDMFLDGNLYG